MGCSIMMATLAHHGAERNGNLSITRTVTGMARRGSEWAMPERTKPDPYSADRLRQAIQDVLALRGETDRSAAIGADCAEKTLRNLLLPEGHKDRTDTLRLDSAVRIAAYLRVTLSQLVGEESLEAKAAKPESQSAEQSSAYAEILAFQARRIAQLEAEVLRRASDSEA